MDESREAQREPPIGEILKQLDSKCSNEGIKPLEAREYRQEVIGKYGLPETAYKFSDPRRYIGEVEELANKWGVQVRPRHEFEKFFQENPEVGAWFHSGVDSGPMIVTNPPVNEPEEWFRLRARANQLSHEIVHVLQNEKYPRMPIKEQEREAYYYQILDDNFFRRHANNPDFIYRFINETLEDMIKSSTTIDNKLQG